MVGPNGSGKSNISDSLRWVMGEQSAKSLRGARMEDIIFAGSAKRKPVGMAEVAITFDNSTGLFPLEYNEVTVTRRVFRSGDSDYLINKTPCRLRDIHELFMDTGIGKEAYSIIGQGKVEEIISAKAEERRVLIEEAAGIIKYRTRKMEAMRKLSDTEQDLLRISDIINELESQLEPMAEQAAKAEQYNAYKGELSELEINLAANQLNDHKLKLTQIQEQIQTLRQHLESSEAEQASWESKIASGREQIALQDQAIELKQQELMEEVTLIERTEAKINVAEERSNSFSEQRERLTREIQELTDKVAALDEEFQVERQRLEEIQTQAGLAKGNLADFENQYTSLQSSLGLEEETIETHKGDIIDLLNQMAELRNQVHGREAESEGLKRRRQQISSGLEATNSEGQQQEHEMSEALSKAQATQDSLDQKTQLGQDLAAKEQKLLHNLSQHKLLFNQLQSTLNTKTSRHKVLSDMQQDYEGYQKGVREVLLAAQKGKLRDICGVVAELIQVPAKFETAVEVTLGGALQNIVTKTDLAAKEAINYLKGQNLGRATFLPINTIKSNQATDSEKQALNQPGALGLAVNLVEFAPEYRPVMEYLLGRVIVVENIDRAVAIAQKTNYRVRLVTLDGDVISPGGSLSGGSYQKRGSNLLGRTREVNELQNQIKQVEAQLASATQVEGQLNEEINAIRQQMTEVRQEMQQHQIGLAALVKDVQQLEEAQKRLNQQKALLEMEEAEIDQRLAEITGDTDRLQEQLLELEQQNHQLQAQVTQAQNSMKDKLTQRNSMSDELTALKVKVAELVQEEQGLQQSLYRYNQNKAELQHSLSSKGQELSQFEGKKEDLLQNITVYRQEVAVQIEAKKQLDAVLTQLRTEREKMASQLAEAEKDMKLAQKLLTDSQNTLHASEVKQAKIEMEVENCLQKLTEDYAMSYEEAMLVRTDIPNRKVVTQRIHELKSFITGLGTVNLGAIEENQRIQERYGFLTAQIADLEGAKASLYEVINEMNEIMTVRFREAFEAIRVNFEEVFIQLFGGGHAQLQLTNPDNILETGVDIVAQPPGKKPQHLSLLSGGEKALTAISLLFAILRVKPSPFCVLDEIEASLDDANVRRFADFVKEFARNTQFIVVTHRKGTMEVADVLYGVTMDESGVSKLVSMKLQDEKAS